MSSFNYHNATLPEQQEFHKKELEGIEKKLKRQGKKQQSLLSAKEFHQGRVASIDRCIAHVAAGGRLCVYCGAIWEPDTSHDGWERCSSCQGC